MSTVPLWSLSQAWFCSGQGPGRWEGSQGEGWTSLPFVLKVPRHRDHRPFLAWSLRASGNSFRTIISGGMCYSSILPESRAGMSLSSFFNSRGSRGLLGTTEAFADRGAWEPGAGGVVLSLDTGLSGPSLESGRLAGVLLTPSAGTHRRRVWGGCLPHLLPRPSPEKLIFVKHLLCAKEPDIVSAGSFTSTLSFNPHRTPKKIGILFSR